MLENPSYSTNGENHCSGPYRNAHLYSKLVCNLEPTKNT